MILLKLFLFCWFITRFEPLKWITDAMPDNLPVNLFRLLITCLKCMLFWTTLYITHDIFIASGMAFIGFWYDKIIGYYEDRVRL